MVSFRHIHVFVKVPPRVSGTYVSDSRSSFTRYADNRTQHSHQVSNNNKIKKLQQ